MMNDEFKVDAQNLEQKIEIEKFIQMLLLSSDVESSVSSDSQFVESVGKLSQLSLDELVSAPQRIQKEEGNLRHKIEQLAVENYPIFLANANTSREVHREFMSISESNEILLSSIAGVSSVAQTIFDNVGKSASAFRTSAKSVQQYAQISELLELPQLMETCIQNGYYQDALNILSHTKQMTKKYGRMIPIVRMVGLQAQEISGQLFSHLCKQLQQPITLPVCLKVVIYLRQLEAFSEQELRLNFLQSRGICIKDQVEIALAKPIGITNFDPKLSHLSGYQQAEYKAFIRTMRRIEVTRVQLFDSITQYRAVFADEEVYSNKLSDPQQQRVLSDISPLHLDETARTLRYLTTNQIDDIGPCNEASLFHAWLVRQVGIFLDGLSDDLSSLLNLPRFTPSEISDRIQLAMSNDAVNLDNVDALTTFQQIHSVMTQALYFGRSFARIGCDFRAHLGIIFSRRIFTYFETLLRNASTELSVVVDLWPWELVEPSFLASHSGGSNPDELQAPLEIARHPPIAFFCNRILSAFNGLRICCPIALRDAVLSACVRTLNYAANTIVSAHKTRQLDNSATRAQSVRLASVFAHFVTPHLLTCLLEHVFGGDAASHLWQLHQDSGEGDETLTTSQCISRIAKEVCAPIFAVWGQLAHGPLPVDQPLGLDLEKQELKSLEQPVESKSSEPPMRVDSHQIASKASLIDSPTSDILAVTPNTPAEDIAVTNELTSIEQELPKNDASLEKEPPNTPSVAAIQSSIVHEDAHEISVEGQKLSKEENLQVLPHECGESNEEVEIASKLKGDPILLEITKDGSSRVSGFEDSVQLIDESLDKTVVPVLKSADLSLKYEEKATAQFSKPVSAPVIPSGAEKATPFIKESQALSGTTGSDSKDDRQYEKPANLTNRLSDGNSSSEFFQTKNDEPKVFEGNDIIQSDQIFALSLPPEEATPVFKLNIGDTEPELLEKEGITGGKQFFGPLSSAAGGEHVIDAKGGSAFPAHDQESLSGPQSPEPLSPKGSETVRSELGVEVWKGEYRPPTKSCQIIENSIVEDVKSSAPVIDALVTLNVVPDSTADVRPNDWGGKSGTWNDEQFKGVLPTDVDKNASSIIASKLKSTADEAKNDVTKAEDRADELSLAEPEHHLQEITTDFISVANVMPPLKSEEPDGPCQEGDDKKPIEWSSSSISHSITNIVADVSNEEATGVWNNGDGDHNRKKDWGGTIQGEPYSMPFEREYRSGCTTESNSARDSSNLEGIHETSNETYKAGLIEMEEGCAKEIKKSPEQTKVIFASQNSPIEIEPTQVCCSREEVCSKPDDWEADKMPSDLSDVLLEEIIADKRDSNGSLSKVHLKAESSEVSKIVEVEEGLKSSIKQCPIEVSKEVEDAWRMRADDALNEDADSDDKCSEGEKDVSSQKFVGNYLKAYHFNPLMGIGEPSGSADKLDESEVICSENPVKSPAKTFSPVESFEQGPLKADDAWGDRDGDAWGKEEEISSNSLGEKDCALQNADTAKDNVISKQILEPEYPKSDFILNANNSNAEMVEKGSSENSTSLATQTQASRGFFKEHDSLNLKVKQSVGSDDEWRDNAEVDTGSIVDTGESKNDIRTNKATLGSTSHLTFDTTETTTGVFSDKRNVKVEAPKCQVIAIEPSGLSLLKKSLPEEEEESTVQKEVSGDIWENVLNERARETKFNIENCESEKNSGLAEIKEFNVGIKSNMESIVCLHNVGTVEAEIETLSEQQDAKIGASNYQLKSGVLEPSIVFSSKKQHSDEEEGAEALIGPKKDQEEIWESRDLQAMKNTHVVEIENSKVDDNVNVDTSGILMGSLTEKHDFATEAPNSPTKPELLEPSSLPLSSEQHSEEGKKSVVQGNPTETDDTWGDDGDDWGEVTEIDIDLDAKKKVDTDGSKEPEANVKADMEPLGSTFLTISVAVGKQNIKEEASDYQMKPGFIEPSNFFPSKRQHSEEEEKPAVRQSLAEADDTWVDEGNGWVEGADVDTCDLEITKTVNFAETGKPTDSFNERVESHRSFSPMNLDMSESATGTLLENKGVGLEGIDDRIKFGHSEFTGSSISENQHFKETEQPSLVSRYPPKPSGAWNDDSGNARGVDAKFDGVLKDSKDTEPFIEEIKEHLGSDVVSNSGARSSNVDDVNTSTNKVSFEDSAWDDDYAWGEDNYQTEPIPQVSDSIPRNPAETNIPEKLEFDDIESVKQDTDEKAKDPIDSAGRGDDENAWGDDVELQLGEIEFEKSALHPTLSDYDGPTVPDSKETNIFFQTGFELRHPEVNLQLLAYTGATSTDSGSIPIDIGDVLKDPPKEIKPDKLWNRDF